MSNANISAFSPALVGSSDQPGSIGSTEPREAEVQRPMDATVARSHVFGPVFWEKLTWLRGCLALYVVLHHVRNALWPLVRDLGGAGRWWKTWNSVMGVTFFYGLDAVLLFFLVSGLSIHAATLSRSGGSFSAVGFYRRRLRRLMPALLASCLPVALAYWLRGYSLLPQWSNLLGTLTFQQGILTESFAENSPYWSLANEGYYYLIYPLLWVAMRGMGTWRALALFGLGSLVLCRLPFIGHAGTLAIYYPVWLAGVFLAVTLQKGRAWSKLELGIMLTLVAASMITTLGERSHPVLALPLWHTLTGIALASLLYVWLRHVRVDRVATWLRSSLNTLGEMSYSLYLTHFAVISVVEHSWPHAKDAFLPAAATSLVAVALSLMVAWILYRFVERPFLTAKASA